MKNVILLLLVVAAVVVAADTISVFDYRWSVGRASDWAVEDGILR
jgi:hypothetical protein